MGAKESRPGSSVEKPPSATRAPVVAHTGVEERPYHTTEKDLEKLLPVLKQLSLKERRNDAIVVAENSEEGGRRADSGSGDVEKDALSLFTTVAVFHADQRRMGTKESRPGSSVENPPSATRAPVVAHTEVEERPYRTTEKDLEKLLPVLKQLSLKERRNDAIVVAVNSEEGGRRADSGCGDAEKDVEVVVLDDGSKDGEERGKELVSKEEGRGDVTGSCDVDKDEGSKDEEEREVVMVREEGLKEGSEKEKEVMLVGDVNERKEVLWDEGGGGAFSESGDLDKDEEVVVGNEGRKDGEERGEPEVVMVREEGSKEGSEKEKEVVWVENANEGKDVKGGEEENGGWRVDMKEKLEMPCYPQRPNVKDCAFYLRTGTCSYKRDCRFNHPPDRRNNKIILESAANGKGERKVSESVEKWTCKYYLSPAGCRSGSLCKFRHQREGYGSKSVELNFMGLPIRHGEKKCSYYMQTGSCKFSTNCRYHHPDPTEVGGRDSFSDTLPSNASQVPTTESLQPHLQGNDYEHPLNSLVPLENGDGYSSRPCLSEYQQSLQMTELPQESGQSTSSDYMKNGNCINKPCKADTKNRVTDFQTYHHPRNRGSDSSACLLSPTGLPLRPGRSICRDYSILGICKFGPTCKYDHSDLIFLD